MGMTMRGRKADGNYDEGMRIGRKEKRGKKTKTDFNSMMSLASRR